MKKSVKSVHLWFDEDTWRSHVTDVDGANIIKSVGWKQRPSNQAELSDSLGTSDVGAVSRAPERTA